MSSADGTGVAATVVLMENTSTGPTKRFQRSEDISHAVSLRAQYSPSTDKAIVVVGLVLLPVLLLAACTDVVGAAAPLATIVELDIAVVAAPVISAVEVLETTVSVDD